MIKRILFPSVRCLLRKQYNAPKAGRITKVLVLALLVVSSFVPILVNPGAVYADDTFIKLADPMTLPASNAFEVAFSHDSRYMAVAHDTSPFVTGVTAGLAAPVLISPAAGATVRGTSVVFSWNSVSSATTYSLWVATTPDFSSGVKTNMVVGNVMSYTDTGYPNNGTVYYWFLPGMG